MNSLLHFFLDKVTFSDSVLGSPMFRRSSSEWRSGSGGAGATEYCGRGQEEEEGEKPGARDPDSVEGDTRGVTTHHGAS